MNAKKCKILRRIAFNATAGIGKAGTRYQGGSGTQCRRLVSGCTREVYRGLKAKCKASGFAATLSLLATP